MDFLKHCSTNVHAIDGFSKIHCRIYTIATDPNKIPLSQELPHSNLFLLQNAGLNARSLGTYVAVDGGQLRIWIFGSSEAQISKLLMSADAQIGTDNPLRFADSTKLKCVLSGDIEATDLLAKVASSNNPNLGLRSSASFAVNPEPATDIDDAAFKLQERVSMADELYKYFIEAVIQSISNHMTRAERAIPLNFRTFAAIGANSNDTSGMDNEMSSYISDPQLMDVAVELTTSGSLLVSIKHTSQHLLHQINDSLSENFEVTQFPHLVRVAPGGRIFRIARKFKAQEINGDHEKLDKIEEPGGLKGSHWRQRVTEWLQGVGLPIPAMEHDCDWILISTPTMVPNGSGGPTQQKARNASLTLEWPAMFCFEYGPRMSRMMKSKVASPVIILNAVKELGTEWFQNNAEKGLMDPFEFAYTFLNDHESRESEIKSRRSKKITRTTCESPGLVTSAGGQEVLITNTIYPTPPDGLPSGLTPGGSAVDAAAAAVLSVVDSKQAVPGDSNIPDEAVAVPQDTGDAPETTDDLSDYDMAEEKLDNADDDLFESNGITEADFNFFDEPDMQVGSQPVPLTSKLETVAPTRVNRGTRELPGAVKPSSIPKSSKQHPAAHMMKRATPAIIEKPAMDQEPKTNTHSEIQVASKPPPMPLTPPLNPDSIREDLSMQPSNSNAKIISGAQHYEKVWNRVDFRNSVSTSDRKYADEGRFGFRSGINNADRQSKGPNSIKDLGSGSGVSPSNPRAYLNMTRRTLPESKTSLSTFPRNFRARSPRSNEHHDTDDSNSDDDMLMRGSIPIRSSKRPRLEPSIPSASRRGSATSGNLTMDAVPTPTETETKNFLPTSKIEMLLGQLFIARSTEWSLTNLPPPKERAKDYVTSMVSFQTDLIAIAQILTAQAATGSDRPCSSQSGQRHCTHRSNIDAQDHDVLDTLQSSLGPQVRQQSLMDNAEIRDDPQESSKLHPRHQPKPIPRRVKTIESGDSDSTSSSDRFMFSIPSPSICLQKTDAMWNLLPSASQFWDTLGLGPVNGRKIVKAYCVYPNSKGIHDSIRRFLGNMESAWDNYRLGDHSLGSGFDGNEEGLVPVTVEGSISQQSAMAAMKKTCERLGVHIAKTTREASHCTVVYLINPFLDESAMQGLCTCFYGLVRTYTRNPSARQLPRRCPVLQIVPIRMIASFESLVFLDFQTATTLAREVYDRCPAATVSYDADLPLTSAVSTILADPTPANFHFQLTTDPPSDLLRERACMNVAYCASFDDRWLTVAWTDEAGKYQHTASYNKVRSVTFESIAKEIWDSTLQYIKPRRVAWRIIIAKAGCMENSERITWQKLASTAEQPKFPISLILVSVNTSPMLTIFPRGEAQPQSPVVTTASQHHSASYSTPITTPQTQTFSPGPTPPTVSAFTAGLDVLVSADADPEARLIDFTDESWGIVLARRLSVSRSLVEYNPALASGYLVKRTGPSELDQPVVMEVNVMNYVEPAEGETGGKPEMETVRRRKADALLREVLIMYRGLGLLARLRGMEGVGSCTPWHVSAVLKAEVALRSFSM